MGSIEAPRDVSYQQESWKTVSKATPYNIQISASETHGRTHVDALTQESAEKVSELLMLNHAKYHTLFDFVGFHSKHEKAPQMEKVGHDETTLSEY